MKRLRISIAGVMGFVAVSALAVAALRNANPTLADCSVVVTLLLYCFGILGVVYRKGPKRAFWLGFALAGAAYTFVARDRLFGPFADPNPVLGWTGPSAFGTGIPGPSEPIFGRQRGLLPREGGLDALFDSAHDRAIRRALDRVVEIPFKEDTALRDVLAYITKATVGPDLPHGVPFYVEPLALMEAEKTMESPVALNLKGVPIRTTLRFMLEQLEMYYTLSDGVLRIKSAYLEDENSRALARIWHCALSLLTATVGGLGGLLFYSTRDRSSEDRSAGNPR